MITLLRLETSKELEWIGQMARSIWPVTYSHIISQAQIDYMLDRFYSSEKLLLQLSENRRFYFVSKDDTPIGYIDIECRISDCFIHKFYILTDRQGKGVGTQALTQVYTLSFLIGLPIRLQVNRENYKAINFYFKNGFIIEKIINLDIGNGFFMNDFLMIKQ